MSIWRRQWQPNPVLLPGKSHGRRSLVGYSSWGHEELDTTERLHFHFSLSSTGEGNSSPLQCSCLENPRDGRAWWAAISGVAQSRTRLNDWSDLAAAVPCPLKYCFPLSVQSPHSSEFYLWILDFFTSKGLCSFYFSLIMGPYYWMCCVLLFINI